MEAAPDDDFTSLPVSERLQHRNWKARLSAYEELTKTFRTSTSEDDPLFKPYIHDADILRRSATDSNVAAQESGVKLVAVFIEFAGRFASPTKEQVLPALVDKCFASTRASIKAQAIEICLLYTQVDGSATSVVTHLLAGLKAKQPKTVATCVNTLKELVKQFGIKIVAPQPILKSIPVIFGHTDKTVRSEGSSLVQECYKYLGPGIQSFLTELKPVQVKELTESFQDMDSKGIGQGTGRQMRFTQEQQRQMAIKEAEASLSGATGAVDEDVQSTNNAVEDTLDNRALSEPVVIKVPSDFYEKLSSTKWKERKEEALDPLLKLLQVPNIADADFGELCKALAARMTDANIACVISAAHCLEALALGLGNDFSRYKNDVLAPVLERLKEKKPSVIEALAKCLDAISSSSLLSELLELITTFAKHKNPQVRSETLKWLVRFLAMTKQKPSANDTKLLTATLLPALEDGFEPVRASAQEAMGTLMKIVGERALAPQMEALDDIRKAKIKEYFEKAKVKAKSTPLVPASSTKQPTPALVLKTSSSVDHTAASVAPKTSAPVPAPARPGSPASSGKPVARPAKTQMPPAAPQIAKKQPVSTLAKPALVKTVGSSTTQATEAIKFKYSSEEAEATIDCTLPSEILQGLVDTNWKGRLSTMDDLSAWLESNQSVEPELIIRCFAKRPGWKESNFQVYARLFAIIQSLNENSSLWSKACAALIIPHAADKLGDLKLKKSAGDLLFSIAGNSSLQFVLSQAYDPLLKQKAPKAQADGLLWLDSALRDFGIQGIVIRDMIEFLKANLKSTNPAVRTNATRALTTLKIFVGASVRDFLQDLNPALLTTIDGEFARVEGESPPEPTRFSTDLSVAKTARATSTGAKGGSASTDPLDELYPKMDLDRLISNATIVACNDGNWKVRKEALESIISIIETHKRFNSSIGDLSTVLKLRIPDSNKIVQMLALDIVKKLAAGIGQPFERHCKSVIPPIISILGDQKSTTRSQGLAALSTIVESCGLDNSISSLSAGLESPNPMLRKEVLSWLAGRPEVKTADLTPLIAPTLSCLEDRAAEVRKAASGLLPPLIGAVGYKTLWDAAASLKQASRSLILPQIETLAPEGQRSTSAASSKLASISNSSAPSSRPASAASKPLRKSLAPSQNAISASAAKEIELPPRQSQQSTGLRHSPHSEATKSNQASAAAQELPIRTSDSRAKSARALREQGPLRWHVDSIARPEQVELLYQQMLPHFSPSMLDLLFSTDHHSDTDHLLALNRLDQCLTLQEHDVLYNAPLNDLRPRWIANLDLLLKYLTIRFCDSATTIVLKCLDILDHLISFLNEDGYSFTDHETSCFLPALLVKLGDTKDLIRTRVKTILRQFPTVCPASKLLHALVDYGVSSKNARVRSESLDEITSIIQRNGSSVYSGRQLIPLLDTLLGDKEPSSRAGAIKLVSLIVSIDGSGILERLEHLPPRERELLDEKLKPSALEEDNARISSPINRSKARKSGSDGHTRLTTASAPQAQDRFAMICSTDTSQAIEALKQVQKEISARPQTLIQFVDALIKALASQMQFAFTALHPDLAPNMLRLCKHLMQTLSNLFDDAALSRAVSQETLAQLLAELTRRLLETADNVQNEAITSLSKVLNMVLIRIFHNANKNACFGALLVILEDVTIDLRDLSTVDLEARAKYAELVMKCLWKISKTAKDGLLDKSLELRKLLLDIDIFLTAISPAEWRRRAADNVPLGDMPLRTCKTILQQVVTVKSKDTMREVEAMDLGESSFVTAYLKRLAGGSESKTTAQDVGAPKTNVPFQQRSVRTMLQPPQTSVLDDREVNKTLKDIFDAVGQPDTSKQGIVALYDFRLSHPEAEPRIQSWIDGTGRHFKSYLERAMANVAVDRNPAVSPRQQQSAFPTALPSPTHVRSTTSSSTASYIERPSSVSSVGMGASSEKLANLQSMFGFTSKQA